jgi:hypothetical protein
MVKILIDIPEKEDKKLKHYMYEKNISGKSKAIIEILKDMEY